MISDPLGANPYDHLSFLTAEPERTAALGGILRQVIKPGMSVLDLGCGALGVWAVLAAKLGAARVVGVDREEVETARACASNNKADVQFVRSDIERLDLGDERFDVIVGMVFMNSPWLSRSRQDLFLRAKEKFGKPDAIGIPDGVAYEAVGLEYDPAHCRLGLTKDVDEASKLLGLDLDWLRGRDNEAYERFLLEPPSHRYRNHPTPTELTLPKSFARGKNGGDYPELLELRVKLSGRLTSVRWLQTLRYGDLSIRATESECEIVNPRLVADGEIIGLRHPEWELGRGDMSIAAGGRD